MQVVNQSRCRSGRWSLLALAVVFACTPVEPKTPIETPPSADISISFQDFPDGTVCSVETSGGTLSIASLPGTIRYSKGAEMEVVTCTAQDGGIYDIATASVLPSTPSDATLIAYGTGLLAASYDQGGDAQQNPAGVVRR